jgi:monomeric isocitrate dehydrogenase
MKQMQVIWIITSHHVKQASRITKQAISSCQPGKSFAEQTADVELAARFAGCCVVTENEAKIMEELLAVEGKPQDIGGYFHPDNAKATAAMRPSATLNAIIASI